MASDSRTACRIFASDEINSEVRFYALRRFAEQPFADGSRSTRLERVGPAGTKLRGKRPRTRTTTKDEDDWGRMEASGKSHTVKIIYLDTVY